MLSVDMDTGSSSAGEQVSLIGRKLPDKPSISTNSCKRGVHFDPILTTLEKTPPLPLSCSAATTVPISSKVITVQATMEEGGEGEGAESTTSPNYSIVIEMEPHCSERGKLRDALSDCTVLTELEIGERGEGRVRYGSPENCESTC